MLRAGIRSVLEKDLIFTAVTETSDLGAAFTLVASHRPEIITLGLDSTVGGIEGVQSIAQEFRLTSIVVLSSWESEELVFDSIAAGAAA